MNLQQAAFDYSIRIAELVKHLRSDEKGFPLSDDLLQCGVDVGLLMRDPPRAAGVLECLRKSDYLLEMAEVAGYLTARQTARIRENGQNLMQMMLETKGGQS